MLQASCPMPPSFSLALPHTILFMMNKLIITGLFAILVIACGGNTSGKDVSTLDGKAIYVEKCVVCHGMDGKLSLNGSKDLTLATTTEAERIVQITKGKNTMTPFEGILTPEEIKAVAAYTMTLSAQ